MSSGPIADSNGQIVTPERRRTELQNVLKDPAVQTWLREILPKRVGPDRFVRIAMSSLRRNPDLLNCEPGSFLSAVLGAAAVGLELDNNLGHAYLVPYKRECTLIIGYKGFQELALRSGKVLSIWAEVVRDGDVFDYAMGMYPRLEHQPLADPDVQYINANGQRYLHLTGRNVTHAYACAVLSTGERVFAVMTRKELDAIRSRSRASHSGPWVTDPEEMFKKTAIRRLAKRLPLSPEVQSIAAADEQADAGMPQDFTALSFPTPSGGDDAVPEDGAAGEEDLDAPTEHGRCPVHGKAWEAGQYGFWHKGDKRGESCTPPKLVEARAKEVHGWDRKQLNAFLKDSYEGATFSQLTLEQADDFLKYLDEFERTRGKVSEDEVAGEAEAETEAEEPA